MARQPDGPEDIGVLKRELQEALQECGKLVARARTLLRRSEQDNDPQPSDQPDPFMLKR